MRLWRGEMEFWEAGSGLGAKWCIGWTGGVWRIEYAGGCGMNWGKWKNGAVAQLGERLLCKQEVVGSIPICSTTRNRLKPIQIMDLRRFFFGAGVANIGNFRK